jgi:hypothetical protein
MAAWNGVGRGGREGGTRTDMLRMIWEISSDTANTRSGFSGGRKHVVAAVVDAWNRIKATLAHLDLMETIHRSLMLGNEMQSNTRIQQTFQHSTGTVKPLALDWKECHERQSNTTNSSALNRHNQLFDTQLEEKTHDTELSRIRSRNVFGTGVGTRPGSHRQTISKASKISHGRFRDDNKVLLQRLC